MLLRCGILIALGVAGYWALRLAWADHLSLSGRLADRQLAVRLVASASLYDRLADGLEAAGNDPLPALGRAAALDPANAERHVRLGLQEELSGDFGRAERNLLEAVSFSRLYQPRYVLAQYYFRRRNADPFFRWARAAMETAYGDVSPILDLCWSMRPDPVWLEQFVLPGRPEIARQYLMFLARHGQMSAARVVAARVSAKATPEDRPNLLEFCDRSLEEGSAAPAVEVWNGLCRTGLLAFRPLQPDQGISLTDGTFDQPPLNQGFAWRVNQTPGVTYRHYPGEIRVTFSGSQAESCDIAWQFLPVERGSRYRLRFALRGLEAATSSGIDWRVYTPAGALVGLEPAPDGSVTFTAPADLLRLALGYRRPLGATRLEGTFVVQDVRLEMTR